MHGLEELEEIEDVEVSPDTKLSELIDIYEKIHGFMAGHLHRAVDILRKCSDADLRVITFTANLVATGIRGILAQLLRTGVFNLVITTAGSLDHDIARGFGGKYYKGFFESSDSLLYSKGIHRLGNIYIPVQNYGQVVEKAVYSVLDELSEKASKSKSTLELGVFELIWEIGRKIKDKHSILKAAYEASIPVIVPGFLDGAFGTAVYTYQQLKKSLKLNVFRDEDLLAERFFSAKKALALIVGGGISKHHAIWWAQFRGGYDCAVYITTAVEYDGSLSGAQPREAISWGKIKPEALHVTVYGDATIILPIIAAGLVKTIES